MTTIRARRIRTAAAAALLLAAAVACDDGETGGRQRPTSTANAVGPDGPTALDERTFVSTGVTEGGSPRELVAGTRISLTFDDGDLGASAGCNLFSGDLTIDGDRLLVGTIGGTEMGCPGGRQAQDDWLVALFTSEPRWQLDGDVLTITSGATTVELVDEEVAVPDAALVGPTWILETIIDGDTASSVPAGVSATLTFQPDGQVVGNNGCNGFGGSYRASDTAVTFGMIDQNRRACADERASVETQVMAVVQGEVAYAIDGDVLILTGTDGRGLGYRAGPA